MSKRRRAKGEGSISRRPGGKWLAQRWVGNQRISRVFGTQKESSDWLRELANQVDGGLTLASRSVTLGVFLDEWLESMRSNLKATSWQDYHWVVKSQIKPWLGKVKLRDLRARQIQAFYNTQSREGVSQHTLRKIHAILHKSLKQATRWDMISANPAASVDRPKQRRVEMTAWTEEQARSFLSGVKESRHVNLYFLAIATGLRQGELLGLQWKDVDWGGSRLQIQRQVQRIKGKGLVFTEPKSRAGRRSVVLGPSSMARLKAQRMLQDAEKAFSGKRWEEHDLIFASTRGTPLDQSNVVMDFKAHLRRLGLPEIRFHDLRHTAATIMLQEGIPSKVVQERLGHSQISVTLDTYSHVLPSMQEEAALKVDELLEPIPVEFRQVQPADLPSVLHDDEA